jgi:hypothetical protein
MSQANQLQHRPVHHTPPVPALVALISLRLP